LIFMLGFADEWNELHRWVSDFSKDGQLNKPAIQDFYEIVVKAINSSHNESLAGHYINKVDYNEGGITNPECKASFARLDQLGHNTGAWLLHECVGPLQRPPTEAETKELAEFHKDLKNVEPDLIELKQMAQTLIKHPKLRLYVYSGEYDTFVPKELFTPSVHVLGDLIQYKHFSGSGHDGFLTEPRVWQNLLKN
jgi:hypothetical protein